LWLLAIPGAAIAYMAAFANLGSDIRHERVEIESKDLDVSTKVERLKPTELREG
jgi:hypothetical protein